MPRPPSLPSRGARKLWPSLGRRARPEGDNDDNAAAVDSGVDRARKHLYGCRWLVVDEMSTLSLQMLGQAEARCRELRPWAQEGEPWFGGLNVVLAGDFMQMPPVGQGVEGAPLFASTKSVTTHDWNRTEFHAREKQDILQGIKVFESFDTSMMLTENFRIDAEREPELRRLLNELRAGDLSPGSLAFLRSREYGKWVDREWPEVEVVFKRRADWLDAEKRAEALRAHFLDGATLLRLVAGDGSELPVPDGEPAHGDFPREHFAPGGMRAWYRPENKLQGPEQMWVSMRHDHNCPINKRLAERHAAATGQRMIWAVATDEKRRNNIPVDRVDRNKRFDMLQRTVGSLHGFLPLVRGAPVRFTTNGNGSDQRSRKLGYATGTIGRIEDWWLHPRDAARLERDTGNGMFVCSELPVAVFVRVPEPAGGAFNFAGAGCVIPVQPVNGTNEVLAKHARPEQPYKWCRKMLPLQGAYAVTTYAAQGRTLPCVVAQLNQPPRKPQHVRFKFTHEEECQMAAYVSCSRVRTKRGLFVVEAPTDSTAEYLRRGKIDRIENWRRAFEGQVDKLRLTMRAAQVITLSRSASGAAHSWGVEWDPVTLRLTAPPPGTVAAGSAPLRACV
eukprot:gene15107-18277_t